MTTQEDTRKIGFSTRVTTPMGPGMVTGQSRTHYRVMLDNHHRAALRTFRPVHRSFRPTEVEKI